ncbi:uncharacterized protein LOC143079138 [Mytilus galloprovincialis]|uniref:uncharacterized protein LOC143079138 n=1 Tax=Mytilus galloprovincialis TaxID=29158 RepID=UPI003F7C2F7F
MQMLSYTLFLLPMLSLSNCLDKVDYVSIATPSGQVQGIQRTLNTTGDTIFEFLGIPYAKPPVGRRRFKKPQPIGNWIHTLNATSFGAACSQNVPESERTWYTSGISEDCLFLNIHIPKVISKTKLYSVMIWIHGGGFELGYGHYDDVTEFTMTGNVIVVTLNYRLGVFGFFAMDHPAARGNFGLWDQKLAIQWVHDNIEAFGGNPDSVTIFGESAGAISTSLQSLISSNKGLFQRVICQSGVHSRILMRKPEAIREYAKGLSNRTGCSIDEEHAFVDCLRNLSVQDLLSYTDFYATAQLDKVYYTSDNYPVVDGELFPENPILSLQDPTSAVATFFRSLDMIAGTTSNEGSVLVIFLFQQVQERYNFSLNEGIPHRVTCEEIIAEYVKTFLKQNEELKRKLCAFYFVANSPNEQSLLATHLFADIMCVYPTIKMLELHSMYGATTYHYQFSMSSPEPWGGPFPSWFNGSGHGDELIYMFRPEAVSTAGMKLSRNLIQYWTSFARTGSPNQFGESVYWEQFDEKNMYLDLNAQITLKSSMKPETIKLWSEIYPLIEVAEGIPNQITITTPSGPIRGLKRTDPKHGESVFEFLGIPYAKPPIGQWRFQKPQPIGNWIHTLNATSFGAACSQNVPESDKTWYTSDISEDCLFLNIHIPKVISKTKLYSVMIWIHGGGFEVGYGHQDDVTDFVMTGNVILVTLNYRLGVFGFFAMNHPAARGNFGLWDQKLAIQWVHDNIEAFGGNPGSITIFGESAGAMSTSLQSLISSNKGLFQRVICQSGVHSKILMRKPEAIREYAKSLANRTGCSIDDEYSFVDCLRNLSVHDLLRYTDFYATAKLDKVHYMSDNYPVVDGELFPENPILSLEDPTSAVASFFRSLDMIAGTTSNEGSILVITLFPQIQERFNFSLNEGIPHRVACEEVIAEYVNKYLKQNEEVKRKLCDFYFVANSPNEQSLLATHLLADIMFVYPTIRMLELHSMYGATTYHYQFSMPSPDPWGGPFPSWFNGSGHGDELIYMFRPEAVSTDGMKLSRNLIQYWTSFARTGSPNQFGESVYWEQFDEKNMYLDLNAQITLKSSMKPETIKLWSEIYPLIEVAEGIPNQITITTPSGPIRGLKRTDPKHGESVFEFLGIPYAKPPIRQRRFQKPQPIGNWIHTLNATSFGAACSQNVPESDKTWYTSDISEDCLFLNIHIPKVISKTKLYSVMIWIHGGGFEVGYGHQDDVTDFVMTGNVILVTLNYRLGVFGFFAMNHPAARGNFGLWDQKLAIQWVHDNIEAFGGNPGSITIFGESAGAMSTSLQSLIPSNKGLFQRVICQSGVHSKILMRKPEAIREYAKGLANRTGCSIDDEYSFVDCLRNLSVHDLLRYTDFYATAKLDKVHYMSDNYPVVDGELFPENPILSLEDPTSAVASFFRSLDMIAGTTSNEGSVLVVTLFPQIQERFNFSLNEGIPHRVACEEVIAEYVNSYLKQNEEVKRKLCDFYFVANSPNEQSLLATHLLADIMFVYPTIRMLELHSMYGATTYHYQFSMPSPEPWGGPFPSWFNGSGHGDELIYMFKSEAVSNVGMKLSRNLIQYWSTFARTGSPNGYKDSVVWIPFDKKKREYLDLNAEIMMKAFLKPDTVKLWSEVYPLIDVGQTTASTTTTSRPSTTQRPVCLSNDDSSSVATQNGHSTIILYMLFFKAFVFNSLQ